MAKYQRPLHNRIAALLSRMDAHFLADAQCFFGGGTQIVMSNGEFRESRDIDFLARADGLRLLRETVHEGSLGKVFRKPIHLAREVRIDRYGVRTFVAEDSDAEPIKFEIVLEARVPISGGFDSALGIARLDVVSAITEKLLANADRGRDRHHYARDVIDLAFFSFRFELEDFRQALTTSAAAYGATVMKELKEVLRMLESDSKYRELCVKELLVSDPRRLREGLQNLRQFTKKSFGGVARAIA